MSSEVNPKKNGSRAPKEDFPTRAPGAERRAPIFSEQEDFRGFHYHYWGGKGSWTKSKNSGPFWFTMNPSVKFHRSNLNLFFWTKYKNNQKMKTQVV